MGNIISNFQRLAIEAATRNGQGNPERNTTDETFQRIKEYLPAPRKPLNPKISKEEKLAMYQDILGRIKGGQSPQEIAASAVQAIQDIVEEKVNEAENIEETADKPDKKPKSPIFRRVE